MAPSSIYIQVIFRVIQGIQNYSVGTTDRCEATYQQYYNVVQTCRQVLRTLDIGRMILWQTWTRFIAYSWNFSNIRYRTNESTSVRSDRPNPAWDKSLCAGLTSIVVPQTESWRDRRLLMRYIRIQSELKQQWPEPSLRDLCICN
jgi:hypothetical protein